MTIEQATEHLNVAASPQSCIEVALDLDRYQEWALDIKESTVLERDERGRASKVQFRAAAMGRSASYVLAYAYSDDNHEVRWSLVEGDIMKSLDGSYVFVEGPGNSTDVSYHISVELIVPIPGFVKRRAEGKIIGTALKELKNRVESLNQ